MLQQPAERGAGHSNSLTQVIILVLIIAAAAIHFSRAAVNPHIAVLFTLNGLGYLGLGGLLSIPSFSRWQRPVRLTLLGYTLLTLALFFLWGFMKGEWLVIGFVCAVIEMALVGVLWRAHQDR